MPDQEEKKPQEGANGKTRGSDESHKTTVWMA